MQTFFEDFARDDGSLVTVEYSARSGEPNFDHPGHICDGGGSGPEICIVDAWPGTAVYERLCGWKLDLEWPRSTWLQRPAFCMALFVINIAIWILKRRIRLSCDERERMESVIAEHHVEDPYEPEDY